MQGAIAKPDKPESQVKNAHDSHNPYIYTDSRLVQGPEAKLINSRIKNQQNSLYLSRFNGELPEERLRKSKAKSIKMRDSNEVKMSLRDDVVKVKEEKPLLNSTVAGLSVPGFEDLQYQNKQIKKFTITALVKERDLIKESNYFDESYDEVQNCNPVVDKSRADFRIGQLGSFETFQVKTYLFDRNLTRKIAN